MLLGQADKRSGKTIQGITKLAKLDFLLRYPNCLERLLKALNKSTAKANIKDYEKTTIESKMVRFRYGPWDERYRRWIGLLVAKGLALTYHRGRTVHIGLTEAGRNILGKYNSIEEFDDLSIRSEEIFKAVGALPGTRLKDLIYDVFPEIVDLKWGQGINL